MVLAAWVFLLLPDSFRLAIAHSSGNTLALIWCAVPCHSVSRPCSCLGRARLCLGRILGISCDARFVCRYPRLRPDLAWVRPEDVYARKHRQVAHPESFSTQVSAREGRTCGTRHPGCLSAHDGTRFLRTSLTQHSRTGLLVGLLLVSSSGLRFRSGPPIRPLV